MGGLPVDVEKIGRQTEADDGLEEGRLFAVEAEIAELDLGPAADEVARFVNGGGFVETRQPGRRREGDQKHAPDDDRDNGLARADIGWRELYRADSESV